MKSAFVSLFLLFIGAEASIWQKADARSVSATNSTQCVLYDVKSNDTCFTIASAENVTWAQLAAWNPSLQATCSNPAGNYSMPTQVVNRTSIVTTTAAIPSPTVSGSNADCGQWWLHVGDGDNCDYATETYDISLTDFIFLNPEVWTNCTNLWAGYYYCVEAVGYISTYPGYGTTPTPTSTFSKVPTTSLPWADPLAKYSPRAPVIPMASGTRKDCFDYTWHEAIFDDSAADCWQLAFAYGVTVEEIVLWNPSLAESTDTTASILLPTKAASANGSLPTSTSNPYTYQCTISPSLSYCVQLAPKTTIKPSALVTPTPLAAGETTDCTVWTKAQTYSTCEGILALYAITMTDFYDWNPTVGPNCTGLVAGTYYCVSIWSGGAPSPAGSDVGPATTASGLTTLSPVQTGMVANCDDFYDVQPGDDCETIASEHNITLTEFSAWSPAVGCTCADLELNVYVCVGVVVSSNVTASSTTALGASSTTLSPVQTGMISDCDNFYEVQSGDTCDAIVQEFDISLDDFYAWNPAVGTSCLYLDVSVYVCVGVE